MSIMHVHASIALHSFKTIRGCTAVPLAEEAPEVARGVPPVDSIRNVDKDMEHHRPFSLWKLALELA